MLKHAEAKSGGETIKLIFKLNTNDPYSCSLSVSSPDGIRGEGNGDGRYFSTESTHQELPGDLQLVDATDLADLQRRTAVFGVTVKVVKDTTLQSAWFLDASDNTLAMAKWGDVGGFDYGSGPFTWQT